MRNVILSAVFVVGCGSSQKSAPAPDPEPDVEAETDAETDTDPAAGGAADGPVAGGTEPWSALEREQRIAHMKEVVLPKMKELWKQYDPDKYQKITCLHCHGDGVIDGDYKMPNPELPKLPFGEGWEEYAAKHEKMLAFMKDTVSPTMAELLGRAKYSEDNPDGFGCLNCHLAAE